MHANYEVKNWGGTITSHPSRLERPSSIDQIQDIIRNERDYPSPVRAVGSNHSTTRCGVADGGTLLEMCDVDHIHVDPDACEVTAGAGAIYIDVAEAVAEHGFQLFVNPEIGNVSVGSACCGGTKDASMPGEKPQLSSYCVRMKVVRSNGTIATIHEGDDEMQIMRSSYGMLGIVYEATFRIKPTVAMRFSHESMSVEAFIRNFDEIRQKPCSMMLYVLPFRDRIVIEYREEVEDGPFFRSDALKWWLRNKVWSFIAPAFGRLCSFWIPFRRPRYALVNLFNDLVIWVLCNVLEGRGSHPKDQIIRYPDKGGWGMYTFSIWAFPEERFPETVRDYVAFCKRYDRDHGYRCNMLNVGYRFAQDEGSILSYSYTGDMWSLDVVSTGDDGWDRFVWSYNRFCSEKRGKPLFNQTRSITPEQAADAFPGLLEQYRQAILDQPNYERFLNQYFAWLLRLSPASAAVPGAPGQP